MTSNKTASDVAARGFPLYLARCENEREACELGEGWFLVSRSSSSNLTFSHAFPWRIFLTLGTLHSLGDFWNYCSEIPSHCTLQSYTAGGIDWDFQEEGRWEWLTAPRMADRKWTEWNAAFSVLSLPSNSPSFSLALDYVCGYFDTSVLAQTWTTHICFCTS